MNNSEKEAIIKFLRINSLGFKFIHITSGDQTGQIDLEISLISRVDEYYKKCVHTKTFLNEREFLRSLQLEILTVINKLLDKKYTYNPNELYIFTITVQKPVLEILKNG